MPLPSNDPISLNDAYEERFGNSPPSGQYTIEQLQADWNLPETPDDTSIFEGKGFPSVDLVSSSTSDDTITLQYEILDDTGFSGSGGVDYRYVLTEESTLNNTYSSWFQVSATYKGNLTEHTFQNLNPDTTYYLSMQMQLVNWSNRTEQYSEGQETTADIDTTPPSVPQNLTGAGSIDGSGDFTLDWDASSDSQSGIAHYWVYSPDLLGAYANGAVYKVPSGTSLSDNQGISYPDSYDYRVSAENNAGLESDKSNTETITTR